MGWDGLDGRRRGEGKGGRTNEVEQGISKDCNSERDFVTGEGGDTSDSHWE